MPATMYDTAEWQHARSRALARDGERCTVRSLIGGACHGTLHVHHVVRPEDGGDRYDLDNLATVCASHHPTWESVRRAVARARDRRSGWKRCTHRHPYPSVFGRDECERRMNAA